MERSKFLREQRDSGFMEWRNFHAEEQRSRGIQIL
jgi:hypothetical protein